MLHSWILGRGLDELMRDEEDILVDIIDVGHGIEQSGSEAEQEDEVSTCNMGG
jgi:hypothetical protein